MEKFKCVRCREYKSDSAFGLCDECERDARREESKIEKEFGTPKEV